MKLEAILTFLVAMLFVYSLIVWSSILVMNVSQPTGQLSAFREEIQKDVGVMYNTMSKEVANIFKAVEAFQTFNTTQILPPRFPRSVATSIEQQLLAQQLYR
jgi:hypothetical protein